MHTRVETVRQAERHRAEYAERATQTASNVPTPVSFMSEALMQLHQANAALAELEKRLMLMHERVIGPMPQTAQANPPRDGGGGMVAELGHALEAQRVTIAELHGLVDSLTRFV